LPTPPPAGRLAPPTWFAPLLFSYKAAGFGVYELKVNSEQKPAWCERLYQAKAAGLILDGRGPGHSHGEAEGVVQEIARHRRGWQSGRRSRSGIA